MFPEYSCALQTGKTSDAPREAGGALALKRGPAPSGPAADPSEIQAIVLRASKQYATRSADDTRRSVVQLITTFVPFLALLGVMMVLAQSAYWATLLLAVPTAGLLVRLFIFQHDCGHGSFFKSRSANTMLGRFISIFTLTPYEYWKRYHALHHATSGNLDKRGLGDVPTITVKEYLALSSLKKLGYRLFRNPVFMVAIAVPFNFIVLQRLPLGRDLKDPDAVRSIMGLNLMMLVVFGGAMAVMGVGAVIAVFLPVIIIAAGVGGWLFYVQHQFEDAYWRRTEDWDFQTSALSGSSYYKMPPILQWFTGNIGLHHIHHLCSRIPNHRLQECADAFPELNKAAKRITLRDSLDCWRYSLWDEDRGAMIGFRDLRERA